MLQTHLKFFRGMGIEAVPLSKEMFELFRKPEKKNRGKLPETYKRHVNKYNPPPASFKTDIISLEKIREELGECKRCKLYKERKNIVFGEGNPGAKLVFIGEGPGSEEDMQGRPFVGKAGQLLTKIIENGMKLKRKDVYICNIVKCRPPENRAPEEDEIETCRPFLDKQIAALQPKVIITLGQYATSTLKGRPVKITGERGKWFGYAGIRVMPTYHPSYLLRNYTREIRMQVYDDVRKVMEVFS